MIKKIKWLFGVFIISSSTVYAQVDTFVPVFPKFSSNASERQSNHQFYSLGNAHFSTGVSIPFYGVTALNPVTDGLLKDFKSCPKQGCNFRFKLQPELAKQLKLLALPELGLVLVPREWNDIQVNVGANGSGLALIMSVDQKQAIQLYDSSLCVGCGMPYATLYFPELLQESLQNEFGGYRDPQKRLRIVHPSKHVAFFSYALPDQKKTTHGIAKYINDGDFNFKEIKVTLEPSQQALTRTILNFYQFNH